MEIKINIEEIENEIRQIALEEQAEWLAWLESQMSEHEKLLAQDYA